MNHIYYDKCLENPIQVCDLHINAKMGKTTELTIQNSDSQAQSVELTYVKNYSRWQRAGRFCEGLFLSVISGGFGLIDLRVRHKFMAALAGNVEKKVCVNNEVFEKAMGELLNEKTSYGLAIKGERLLEKGDTDNAIAILQKATNEDPTSSFAVGLLGEAQRLKKLTEENPALSPSLDPDSGMSSLKKSIELDPKNAFAHGRLGASYKHSASFYRATPGDLANKQCKLYTEKAKKSLQTAIDLNPNDIFAHTELGLLLKLEENHQKSLEHLKKAYDLDNIAKVNKQNGSMSFEGKIALIEVSMELGLKDLSSSLELTDVIIPITTELAVDEGTDKVERIKEALQKAPIEHAKKLNIPEKIKNIKVPGEATDSQNQQVKNKPLESRLRKVQKTPKISPPNASLIEKTKTISDFLKDIFQEREKHLSEKKET